jgi:hypothetical protein
MIALLLIFYSTAYHRYSKDSEQSALIRSDLIRIINDSYDSLIKQ